MGVVSFVYLCFKFRTNQMLSLSPNNCRWYNDVGEGMCGIKNFIEESWTGKILLPLLYK